MKLNRVRDGDTVEVRIQGGSLIWAIRLLECWAPELNTAAGKEAKKFAEEVLADVEDGGGQLYLYLPGFVHLDNLLKNLTFDRLLGHVFISSEKTLSEAMVAARHATKEKLSALSTQLSAKEKGNKE